MQSVKIANEAVYINFGGLWSERMNSKGKRCFDVECVVPNKILSKLIQGYAVIVVDFMKISQPQQ